MKIHHVTPPREFGVGHRGATLAHVADIELAPDEVITFTAASGSEVDVTRKSWGYYATTSLNGRLREHGLRAALCVGVPREPGGPQRMYLLLVESGREDDFESYIDAEKMYVVAWLDTDEAVAQLTATLKDGK